MLSYHNDPAVKARHVALAKHHYEADMLRTGTYGEGMGKRFKACSVGCMAHGLQPSITSNWHAVVAKDAGWPEWLAHLNDAIFEGLPASERNSFHVQLREAVPVGINLEPLWYPLAVRRLDRLITSQNRLLGKHGDTIDAVIRQTLDAIKQVKQCHKAEIGLNVCSVGFTQAAEAAESAAEAAWAAAEEAWAAESAQSAQSVRTAEAAESAAWAAQSAAESARSAWAAARAAEAAAQARAVWEAAWAAESAQTARSAAEAARSAARSVRAAVRAVRAAEAAWIAERDDLLDILRAMEPTA